MFESESKTVGEREAYSHVRGSSSLGCAGRNRYMAHRRYFIYTLSYRLAVIPCVRVMDV